MDDLGTRMKVYEKCYNVKLPKRLPVIIRIDGKSFHSMVKKWQCKTPFDDRLIEIMQATTQYLCNNISGCELGYVQSDEISLLLRNDQTLNTQPYFDNKLQKLCSVVASMATMTFNHCGSTFFKIPLIRNANYAMFDARVFILPKSEVVNYFIWRQQDASRNSVQMLARPLYSHKKCNNKNSSQLQEMCFQKGQNWNDLETYKRRGTCLIKKDKTISTPNGEVIRKKWVIDKDIPVFTQDREYIENTLVIS